MSETLSLGHNNDYRKQTHFVINKLYKNYELENDTVKTSGGPLGVPYTSSGYYYRGHPVLHPHKVLVFPRTVTRAAFSAPVQLGKDEVSRFPISQFRVWLSPTSCSKQCRSMIGIVNIRVLKPIHAKKITWFRNREANPHCLVVTFLIHSEWKHKTQAGIHSMQLR